MNGRCTKSCFFFFPAALALMTFAVTPAHAQSQPPPQGESESVRLYNQITWISGPKKVQLGNKAELSLPAGYSFTGAEGARLFSEATQNPPGPNELGVIIPSKNGKPDPTQWCIVFSYSDSGHVNDDEKDKLTDETATATLESIRQGTDEANSERTRRGWPTLQITGWEQKPFYDQNTHHITWAIKVSDSSAPPGSYGVNYNSRVLGREGVISVNLITDPQSLSTIVPTYNNLVSGMTYQRGQRYEEFRPGDKVAKYGLIGLMTGGAAVVAVKAWKPLIKLGAIVVAALGGLVAKVKSWFKGKTQ